MKSLQDILNQSFAVMGILNVTPDSFSDGGKYLSEANALDHATTMAEQGADIIDIGGESTRPGANPVSAEEECARVLPVIRALSRQGLVISIDTTKALVAQRALEEGASLINDVSAGRFDDHMAPLAGRTGAPIILMHSRRTPATMQVSPYYRDVVIEVKTELTRRVEHFLTHGVKRESIILDPGFGFAKRLVDNVELLHHLGELSALGFPLLVGTSRKSFIGALTGKDVEQRLAGSLATVASAYTRGARLFRVHDVAQTVDFLRVLSSVELSSGYKV